VYEQAEKFTDEAYRTMFLKEAKVFVVEKDANGNQLPPRELTEEEKFNLKPGSDGKIHIADNGINNDLDGANKYANQHSTADGPQYFIHFPKAEKGLSELLIAGYQKYLESDLMGLANATELTREYMQIYGKDGLHLDGHSRGSLTVGNAMESLQNLPDSKGMLSGTTISFLGPAYNAAAADDLLSYLQDRPSLQNPEASVLTLQNHSNDLVGRLIGNNPATGGVTPEGKSTIWEFLRVLGGTDTAHNCYAAAAGAGCSKLWEGSPGNMSLPIPINQVDKSMNEWMFYRLEKLRGSTK
jgi:filamentous hemagglutinin